MRNVPATSVAIDVPTSCRPDGWRGQFAHPTGMLGRAVGHLMALKNRERSWWVLPMLEIRQNDRVLEVGFGSGIDIKRVSEMVLDGFVAGIDHSEVMLAQAQGRNAPAIRGGNVELKLGSAHEIPYPDNWFDIVFSINVAQFWNQPVDAMAEMRRVLRRGGLIAAAVQPRAKGATERTARETGKALVENLRAAGFSDVRLEVKKMKPVSTVCALGVK